jgi:hypothetical protein
VARTAFRAITERLVAAWTDKADVDLLAYMVSEENARGTTRRAPRRAVRKLSRRWRGSSLKASGRLDGDHAAMRRGLAGTEEGGGA